MDVDVAIIGGGISGLAAAYRLRAGGHRVVVLERQVTTGGSAISERINGFLMEHGPSTVNAQSPAASSLSADLNLESQRCDLGAGVKRRYLVGDGELRAISIHPLGFLCSNYLSLGARLRLMAEPLMPRRDGGDETIAGFTTRRFGREFTDRVIDPLVGGIYAGRADQISVAAGFPKLVEMERDYGSVTRGLLHLRRRAAKMPGRRLFSWTGGVGTLPATLRRRLGDGVKTGMTVRRIAATADGYAIDAGEGGRVTAKAVVIATQPHVARQLLEPLDQCGAAAAAKIVAPPLAVVCLGYRRDQVGHPLDGLGFLTPEDEGRGITGAQFHSTMFPGRAPDGFVTVSGYVGGARAPELARRSADDLIALVREEFRDLIGARGLPVIARVRHWPLGLPQYRIGHDQIVSDLATLGARRPGLFMTGNYFSGPSVAACVAEAQKAAAGADAFLRAARTSKAPRPLPDQAIPAVVASR